MRINDKKEMAERFRLYGEIFTLCVEMEGEDDVADFGLDLWELMECTEFDTFDINVDGSDNPESFDGFRFEEYVLWVDYGGSYAEPFFDISSESLQKVLEVLTKYKEVES